MSTYNSNSSYSRTYEKKVVEEAPRRAFTTTTSVPAEPDVFAGFPSARGFPAGLGPVGPIGPIGPLGLNSGFHGGTYHSIKTTDDSISVTLDVKEYKPDEIQVSVVGQNIVVEAKHGEKADDLGTIERSFVRRIPLPRGVQPEAVTSNLTPDGALSIIALPPKPKENSPNRTIPIKVQVNNNA